MRLVGLSSRGPGTTEQRQGTYTLPDMEIVKQLQPPPPWPGPWPESVADLPKTPEMQRRLSEFESLRKLDYSLGFLARLRRCLGSQVKTVGGVFVELWFDVESETGRATGSRVAIHESALEEDEDRVVLKCLESEHIGRSFVFESWPSEPDAPAVQKDGYLIRTALDLPIQNQRLYRALLKP